MAKAAVAKQTNRAKNNGKGKYVSAKKEPTRVRKGASPPQHVLKQQGLWVVKSAGSGRVVSVSYPSKPQAIDEGRRIANALGSDLLVHGKSGQIFQHSPIPSELPDDEIRLAIRSAKQKAIRKTTASRSLKKSAAKKK